MDPMVSIHPKSGLGRMMARRCGKLTTARVAQIVDVPEATWVLYFFINRLRVDSSIIQVF